MQATSKVKSKTKPNQHERQRRKKAHARLFGSELPETYLLSEQSTLQSKDLIGYADDSGMRQVAPLKVNTSPSNSVDQANIPTLIEKSYESQMKPKKVTMPNMPITRPLKPDTVSPIEASRDWLERPFGVAQSCWGLDMQSGDDGVTFLEEKSDEEFEPTGEAIDNYAEWIGMDKEEDQDILYLAREGL